MNRLLLATVLVSAAAVYFSCTPSIDEPEQAISVVARDFNFEVVNGIPSGWNTFRFENAGHAEHFFLLNRLPDSVSYERYVDSVTDPFNVVFDSIKAGMGQDEAINMLIEMIPGWYFTSVPQMGGTGIVDPGMTTTVTLNLSPGTYAMECYIKEQGVFHTALGMIRRIVVTEDSSTTQPPKPNYELSLSNYEITTSGQLNRGRNTVAVHFIEHPELGLGNDVHVIRLNDTTTIEDVTYWLNWMNVEGLQSPAPVDFLGGVQEMPAGHTAYFTVDLTAGDYAWIAESTASLGVVKKFTVR